MTTQSISVLCELDAAPSVARLSAVTAARGAVVGDGGEAGGGGGAETTATAIAGATCMRMVDPSWLSRPLTKLEEAATAMTRLGVKVLVSRPTMSIRKMRGSVVVAIRMSLSRSAGVNDAAIATRSRSWKEVDDGSTSEVCTTD